MNEALTKERGGRQYRKPCAVVLGGYVNGYNIIRELRDTGVDRIVLLEYEETKRFARHSRFLEKVLFFRRGCVDSLLSALQQLHEQFDYEVLFPTDDAQCSMIADIYLQIEDYCFIPFDPKTLAQYSDKLKQYEACDTLGVPRPQTTVISSAPDLELLEEQLPFPIVIKPTTRQEGVVPGVFRNASLSSIEELRFWRQRLIDLLGRGVTFLASEVIPGPGDAIYSYMGYRDAQGRILGEWVGRKLSQFPDDFGVFSSASNQCPDIIAEQGRALLHGLDLRGINQPEFKYDSRDGRYKLTEINLRSMMWHRLGYCSGVHLHATQFCDALGMSVSSDVQNRRDTIHLVYMKHELLNVMRRKGYRPTFMKNCFGGDRRVWAVWEPGDPRPFLAESRYTAGVLARQSVSRLLSTLGFRRRGATDRASGHVRSGSSGISSGGQAD